MQSDHYYELHELIFAVDQYIRGQIIFVKQYIGPLLVIYIICYSSQIHAT